MQEPQNEFAVVPLSWRIVSTRLRKDLMKKPTKASARVGTHWHGDPATKKMTLVLDLTIVDKGAQNPVELGFVSLEGVFQLSGITSSGVIAEVPAEMIIRIGQKVCDTAYGILLAKSVGTALHGLAMPEVPYQAFLPPGYPSTMLN